MDQLGNIVTGSDSGTEQTNMDSTAPTTPEESKKSPELPSEFKVESDQINLDSIEGGK